MWRRAHVSLYPHYFSDRLPSFTSNESIELLNILQKNEFVTSSGMISRNPKSSGWMVTAESEFSDPVLLVEFSEELQELMLSAFAFHEFVSTDANIILKWLYKMK